MKEPSRIKFDPFLLHYDNEMEEFMEERKKDATPQCNCIGGWHPVGSLGCVMAVSEEQLRQDERNLAGLLREKMGIKADDETILKYIGAQAAVYDHRRRWKIRLCVLGGIVCTVAAIVLLWWKYW